MFTHVLPSCTFGHHFIDPAFLLPEQNEYTIRFMQSPAQNQQWRPVTYDEIELLVKNGNTCTNWQEFLVEDPFTPVLIKNSFFSGLIRLASLTECYLQYHDFIVPAGITNSKIIACDIGKNCAIHDCSYISHYIIGNEVILSRIDEMTATDHAKFGEGIVKHGEAESVRVTIDVINEAGGREIIPFADMICADAFLWARYREDTALMRQLKSITQKQGDIRRGYYATIGDDAVIKSCRIIKDTSFGAFAYIKGANKLKNLTVRSSPEEVTQIGEGVELVNGIIGYGCHVFYGVKAVRFILGNNCTLKYGARLIHSVMGDNSTISCCEVLNSLIFPYHEQHHNNSFLIAAMVQGQSNMAAGATVGSNHNTRGNDGEIIAGRGFWPGLSSTLKHNCRFASFVVLNKGNYPAELDIPFPFSLVIDNTPENRLEIMPAYFWMYNMYALERNSKKFLKRDKRKTKVQNIETRSLACDTVGEIMHAMRLLEQVFEQTWEQTGHIHADAAYLLTHKQEELKQLTFTVPYAERSSRPTKILKAVEAWRAYRDMLIWYGVSTLAQYLDTAKNAPYLISRFSVKNHTIPWINAGGQLIREDHLDSLRKKIGAGTISTWEAIHRRYAYYWKRYPFDHAENAYGILCALAQVDRLTAPVWQSYLDSALALRRYIQEQILFTKRKDYINPFRDITYRNSAERNAVLGLVEDNAFIIESKQETQYYTALFTRVRQAL